ncbi:TonB-dependent receptor [Luteimonas sp. XNQY3]|nr:TonB-dependent receptor [Luteimonas sp. XNQY3]MCD9008118.1 TonB-dependent receptor [Luteimonas sp. XNQY3]
MNIRTLGNAISVALLAMASGPAASVAAHAATAGDSEGQSVGQSEKESFVEPNAIQLDTVQVTGTRIRGGVTPSPVVTIGIESIREEGFRDLGEVIRSIPQNFSGGQNPGVLSLGYSGGGLANQNITGGSGLNLRGLGPDATVTLLNGRRMAYGGLVQSVDISAIPVEAVERIEIVPDGASAIYGADAVGGVGNVILRRDFDGVAVNALHGGATGGGLSTREYAVTAGTYWNTGGVLATFKDASVEPVFASERSYTSQLIPPTTLYPGSDLRSGLVTAHQSIGGVAELRLDAFRSERSQLYNLFATNGRNNRVTPETTTTMASPGVEFFLPGDWTASIGAALGKSDHIQIQWWETPGTTVRTRWLHDTLSNDSRLYEVGMEGPVFATGGGDARLAIGAGYRTNDFRQRNELTGATTVQGDESARFAYAEMQVPLVGPDSDVTNVERLSLTAAVRREDHDGFGGVTVPKLGLIYGPSADVTLSASWGKSFKAPTLYQRYRDHFAILERPAFWGDGGYSPEATVLSSGGGNRDLGAERARTWTATLAFHPEAHPGLSAELTWFNIDYTDRAAEPITTSSQALTNPIFAPFIVYAPTAQQQADLLAAADRFTNRTGQPYAPENVVAIIYGQYVNVARQEISGLDLSGNYRFDLGAGRMTLRGAVSWLDSTQQVTASHPGYDLAGTLYNPPKVTGRIGAVWNSGGLTASAFGNYKAGVENTIESEKTASFTTFDAVLRYAVEAPGTGLGSGLEFALSAQNLFDRSPPLHTSFLPGYAPPYDSANYSAVGRFVSLSVSKRW